jgi:hypothetical protein
MDIEVIEQSSIWTNAFADVSEAHRTRIKSALVSTRKNTALLVSGIAGDMKGYTVHDISHLDALWEIGSDLAGDSFNLNPAEVFVFGLSVFLHDSGMTLFAYPQGLSQLFSTSEWRIEAEAMGVENLDPSQIPAGIRDALVTNVLRNLHASQAASLATQSWQLEGKQYHLIEDVELRDHYGHIAGTIAHSHHWDSSTLRARLPARLGSVGSFPATWTVDAVKIAVLLRCADAAHIDHRRAPKFLRAMTRPVGVSADHWNFQSKIAKPFVKDGKLVYSSIQAFDESSVDAWYLSYDMARMVDRELGDAHDILASSGTELAVRGVAGVRSVSAFAELVTANGWVPVGVDLQVSDVPHLAKTLGGSALYSSPVAPLRELLQNAADAVDARSLVDESYSSSTRKIAIRIQREGVGWRLEVDDNGLGMSAMVLTRALLDFGKSFWRSQLAREEYPSMRSGFSSARGKFGIGFFSTFMWSDEVKVASRRFSDGANEAHVLEFRGGISHRPVLRKARPGELPLGISTRVSLKVSDDVVKMLTTPSTRSDVYDIFRPGRVVRDIPNGRTGAEYIVAALSIPVHLEMEGESKLLNQPDWESKGASDFVTYFAKYIGELQNIERVAALLTEVVSDDFVHGKALVAPPFGEKAMRGGLLIHDRGITIATFTHPHIFGVLSGKPATAARDRPTFDDPSTNIAWLEQQKKLLMENSIGDSEIVASQDILVKCGTFSEQHVMFLLDRRIASLDKAKELVSQLGEVSIWLSGSSRHEENFTWKAAQSLDTLLGLDVQPSLLHVLCEISIPEGLDVKRAVLGSGSSPFERILASLGAVLGPNPEVEIELVEVESYSRRTDKVVTIKRGAAPPAD